MTVSRRELDRLRERRESVAPSLEYAPGSSVRREVRKIDELRRNQRAAFIEERLHVADGRAENDFASAKTRDRARYDFERSR